MELVFKHQYSRSEIRVDDREDPGLQSLLFAMAEGVKRAGYSVTEIVTEEKEISW